MITPIYLRGLTAKPARRKTPIAKPASLSKHEKHFQTLWERCGGNPMASQVKFHPARRWRFDFADTQTKVGIEIHGGTFAQGRHTTGKGFEADREKMNAAQAAGWVVFELTPKMIGYAAVEQIAEKIHERFFSILKTAVD